MGYPHKTQTSFFRVRHTAQNRGLPPDLRGFRPPLTALYNPRKPYCDQLVF